jgi:hypothetical protein
MAGVTSCAKQSFADLGRVISGNTSPNPLTGSPLTKKASKEILATPNSAATVEWTSDLTMRMGQMVIEAVDARMAKVERDVEVSKKDIEGCKSQAKSINTRVEKCEALMGPGGENLHRLEAKIEEVKLELEGVHAEASQAALLHSQAVATAVAAALAAPNAGGRNSGLDPMQTVAGDPWSRRAESSEPAFVPHEMRTLATFGSLGWNTGAVVLEQRANALLLEAGVATDVHSAPVASHDPGSVCSMIFNTPADLLRAKLKVKSLRRLFEEARGEAWIDASKTWQELLPSRVIGKAFRLLADWGAFEVPVVEFELDMKSKQVKIARGVICYTSSGKLVFSAAGKQLIEDDAISYIIAAAQE